MYLKNFYSFLSLSFSFLNTLSTKASFNHPTVENIVENLISSRQSLQNTVNDIKNLTLVNKEFAQHICSPQTTSALINKLAHVHNLHILEAAHALHTQASKQWLENYEFKINKKLKENPSIHDIPALAICIIAQLYRQQPSQKIINWQGKQVSTKTLYISKDFLFIKALISTFPDSYLWQVYCAIKENNLQLYHLTADDTPSYSLLQIEKTYKELPIIIRNAFKQIKFLHSKNSELITDSLSFPLLQSEVIIDNCKWEDKNGDAIQILFEDLLTKFFYNKSKEQLSFPCIFKERYIGMRKESYKKVAQVFDLPE